MPPNFNKLGASELSSGLRPRLISVFAHLYVKACILEPALKNGKIGTDDRQGFVVSGSSEPVPLLPDLPNLLFDLLGGEKRVCASDFVAVCAGGLVVVVRWTHIYSKVPGCLYPHAYGTKCMWNLQKIKEDSQRAVGDASPYTQPTINDSSHWSDIMFQS